MCIYERITIFIYTSPFKPPPKSLWYNMLVQCITLLIDRLKFQDGWHLQHFVELLDFQKLAMWFWQLPFISVPAAHQSEINIISRTFGLATCHFQLDLSLKRRSGPSFFSWFCEAALAPSLCEKWVAYFSQLWKKWVANFWKLWKMNRKLVQLWNWVV